MEDGAFIISWINALIIPTAIYQNIESIALGIFKYITPVLLVIAIAVRTLEESLDATNTNGRWINAVRDMILAGLAIAVYFSAGNLINDFFESLYSYFSNFGSIGSVTNQVADMIDALERNTEDTGFANWGVSGIYKTLALGVYYLSLITVTSIIAFLHIAHAIGYGLVFCWGLIALPMSITRGFTLLKGWGLFMAFILVWPILESLAMGMLMQIFVDVGTTATAGSVGNTRVEQGSLLLAFTTLNIILIVVVVVIPFLTNGFVSNSAVGRDFVIPFAAGAMAQVASVKKSIRRTGAAGRYSRDAINSARPFINQAGNAAIDKVKGFGSESAPSPKSSTPQSSVKSTSASSSSNSSPGDRQARRGAIINQQNKGK